MNLEKAFINKINGGVCMNSIEIKNLKKSFGKYQALNGIDLEVKRGEVYGFIGPNGAGKSTTIRIILGMLRKDSGEVTLLGGDPWGDAVELHRRTAYVPGDVTLWPNLTGGEVIDFLGSLNGGFDPNIKKEMVVFIIIALDLVQSRWN